MRRRDFITLLGGAAVAWPLAAHAQQGERMRRIGILMPYPPSDTEWQSRVGALRQELHRLGWTRGGNIEFDERWTTDNMDLVRTNAANLVELKPDVIVAIGGRVIPILMQLSRSIPIVIPGASDPVGVGWVQSLARPGGNVTGFTFLELSIFGKILETLKQIAPSITRVMFIYNPDNPNTSIFRRAFEAAAGPLAIAPIIVPIHGLADIDRAIEGLADRQNAGILIPPDITLQAMRKEVVALVARHRLLAIYADVVFVKVGGLASYGADRVDLFRRAAEYVDRILRGEKAGDLPFQQPTKYQLILNLKTAKVLGIELTPAVLAIADEVIE